MSEEAVNAMIAAETIEDALKEIRTDNPIIYLAGPVDLADGTHDWRERAKNILFSAGYIVFDPCAAFHLDLRQLTQTGAVSVRSINQSVLMWTDAILAYTGGLTMETFVEIEHMHINYPKYPIFTFRANPYPQTVFEKISQVRSSASLESAISSIFEHFKKGNCND